MSDHDGVVSIADARRSAGAAQGDALGSRVLERLSQAADVQAFVGVWLDIQCRALEGIVRAAVILRGPGTGKFAPVAFLKA